METEGGIGQITEDPQQAAKFESSFIHTPDQSQVLLENINFLSLLSLQLRSFQARLGQRVSFVRINAK